MRRLGAVAALLLVVAVSAWPARAASDAPAYQAWAATGPGGVAPVQGTAGRLYAAADAGQATAVTFVRADGPVVLAEASDETVSTEASPAALAALAACPLLTPLAANGQLAAADVPGADCTSPVPLSRTDDGHWAVSLDPWPANGVAVVPVLSAAGATFSVSFDAAATTVVLGAPTAACCGERAQNEEAPAAPAAPAPGGAPDRAQSALATLSSAGGAPDRGQSALAAPAGADAGGDAEPAAATRLAHAAARLFNAATPPAWLVLPLAALLAVLLLFLVQRTAPGAAGGTQNGRTPDGRAALIGAAALAFVLLPTMLSETNVYKLGLVLVLLTGAIGLHLLVNWAGELSLAHAPMIGLPAFVVAKLSADHHLSPILLLPVGIAVGLATGATVGLPAIRARGLQVALVTLAAGVAIDRFFFTRPWITGPAAGAHVPTPTLGPLHFRTAAGLYPLLAVLTIAAVAAAWAIYKSKLGRAFLWVKAQPDAAAAFGIPVPRYRTLAYALAGGFAGFSGGLTAMWVQRVTPAAFPLSRSFTYLIIVALAGRGFVGGVAAAAAMVEGGRLFLASSDAVITYGAPLGLILTLTRHPTGLNGLGRLAKERIVKLHGVRVLTIVSVAALAVGFAAIGLAWYHAGNTSQVWVQNQELLSGGVGGLALVVLGVGLLVVDRVAVLLAAARATE